MKTNYWYVTIFTREFLSKYSSVHCCSLNLPLQLDELVGLDLECKVDIFLRLLQYLLLSYSFLVDQ
jgi:hypothetical protein